MKQAKSNPPKAPRSRKSPVEVESGRPTIVRITLSVAHPPAQDDLSVDPRAAASEMLGDLILATRGERQPNIDEGISATYENARQAIAAVRHMQRAVRGFAQFCATGPITASFSLCLTADASAIGGPDSTAAADSSGEDSVLLFGNICTEAKSIPGLRFKEQPSASTGRGKVLQLLPPAFSPPSTLRPPVPATASIRFANATNVNPLQPSVSAIVTSTHRPGFSQASLLPAEKHSTSAAVGPDGPPSTGSSANTRIIGVVAASGIAIVLVLGLILHFAGKSTITGTPAHPAAVSPNASEKPAPPALSPNTTPTPEKPTPTPIPESPALGEATILGKPKAIVAKGSAPASINRTGKREAPAELVRQTGLTFSAQEIASMISKADKLSGDGEYDNAINYYNMVLKQDRKNAEATRGLQRATRNRQH